jgi:Ran GTPase-activating protein (RanGAP) involved in mRNA processing and transport
MLGDQNITNLLEGLTYNTSLRLLNLSQNNIGELGARAIKHYLRSNSNLRILYMRWNSLGVKGSKRIAKALTTNTVL